MKHITTFQAAELLSVSPDSVLKWIKSGKLSAHKTLGGHYRIEREVIEKYLDDRSVTPPSKNRPVKPLLFCWEFKASQSKMNQECRQCLVFKTHARRCYEMTSIPREYGHAKILCETSCEECDYYKHVREQAANILIVSLEKEQFDDLLEDHGDGFNIVTADCEYDCAAIIEKFRPDYAIVDCTFRDSRNVCEHLANDPRVPFIKIIRISESNEMIDFCDNKVIGRLAKPFTAKRFNRFVDQLRR